jgi:hypothetical protein
MFSDGYEDVCASSAFRCTRVDKLIRPLSTVRYTLALLHICGTAASFSVKRRISSRRSQENS